MEEQTKNLKINTEIDEKKTAEFTNKLYKKARRLFVEFEEKGCNKGIIAYVFHSLAIEVGIISFNNTKDAEKGSIELFNIALDGIKNKIKDKEEV